MTTWPATEPERSYGGRGNEAPGPLRSRDRTRVVIAADGSTASMRAAEAVATIYGDADAVVVTVVDGRQVPDRDRAVEILEDTAAVVGGNARLELRVGSPVAEVMRVVTGEGADVVALGAPARTRPVVRAPVGERLLRRLDCDVLVVAAGPDRATPRRDRLTLHRSPP